uniref:Cytochrome b-c1 complex subunit 9 n=1 Tax=Cyanoderma ruficeps TaxID=181631 RepID=A0A8C3RCN6_9PASS
MSHGSGVYGSLFRRTSTFALSVVLGAVLFERVFDQGADALFEQLNEGVRAVGLHGYRAIRWSGLRGVLGLLWPLGRGVQGREEWEG